VCALVLGASDEMPTLSRRHAAGAASARGLLLTILGEFVLPAGQVAWTAPIIEALGQLGVEEKTTRQALMRTAADGWLTTERIGRRTKWHLTAEGEQLLRDGAKRIYSFADEPQKWDGRWLLISARVPETDRSTRHALRTRLSWAGFASLGPGLWISSHPEREPEVEEILRESGLGDTAHIFFATRSDLGDVRTMVREAWDLNGIDAAYRQFIDEFARASDRQPLAREILIVHAWRRFPAIDPALPRELLPARWPAAKAADLFNRRRAQWLPAAQAQWSELNYSEISAKQATLVR
jgi:phenylacetic acid degradation operon negative regulatory protein